MMHFILSVIPYPNSQDPSCIRRFLPQFSLEFQGILTGFDLLDRLLGCFINFQFQDDTVIRFFIG